VPTPIEYASFLIRLWREASADATASASNWCSEIEHIQSGRRWAFNTLDETLSFLRQQVDDFEILGLPVDE
jgi:hypothetical protein